jgi:rhodanese-related sulfurtransferase
MQQIIEFAGNHPILSLLWVALLLALIVSWIQSLLSPIKTVGTSELTMQVNRQDATVLDIRTADEYRKGHITGARNIPLANLKDQLASLDNAKDKPIIVVCFAGMSARGAAATLRKAGFSAVSVLGGGMNAWTAANLPVVKK